MGLYTCRDCKHEVSGSAKRCPHCGAQDPSSPFAPGVLSCCGCLTVIIALVIWGIAAGFIRFG